MGIMRNTASFSQFMVGGAAQTDDFNAWVAEQLRGSGFRSIDNVTSEKSMGFVTLDNLQDSTFEFQPAFIRDPYICFCLRKDERKVPRPVFNYRLEQKYREWLNEHPDFKWVPKGRKEELRELVMNQLLAKTLPIPYLVDAIWNTETGIMTVTTLNQKQLDEFEQMFREAFEGLSLTAIYPLARAEALLDEEGKMRLSRLNKARSPNVLELIKDNTWLGSDFLLWLMYNSATTGSDYKVACEGVATLGEPFVAHIDNRLLMTGGDEDKPQKFSFTGPQYDFEEARAALQTGKRVTEATVYFERAEESWNLTLKGELFRFSSFKSPKVQIERDELTDEVSEREAVFYERMALVETGLQLFDSLLLEFLQVRIGSSWPQTMQDIHAWLAVKRKSGT